MFTLGATRAQVNCERRHQKTIRVDVGRISSADISLSSEKPYCQYQLEPNVSDLFLAKTSKLRKTTVSN